MSIAAAVQPGPSTQARQAGTSATRWTLAHQLLLKWAPYVQEAYGANPKKWALDMAPVLGRAEIVRLETALQARTFDGMNQALVQPSMGTKALGDAGTDLTFVSVPPCRLFDTRIAGGEIANGTTRSFDVTAVSDYSFQGGSASDCGGTGAAGSFAAAAINFTVINSTGSTGYITAFPFGTTQPVAATIAFKGGALTSSMTVVRLDQGVSANEMTIYSQPGTHVVGDIVGYFINPEATALQCVEVDGTPLNLAAGAAGNAFAGACPAGYTAVETQCRPSIFGMRVAGSWSSHCNMVNDSASAGTVTATARCCRVPGR
ncbi:hypothetical protein [Lysobacter fragariae]